MQQFDEIKDTLESINADITVLDTLMQFENVMEDTGMYGYANWEDGEVVSGPRITRYWVEVTLMYPYESMPEPIGGLRLTNLGGTVSYKKDVFVEPTKVHDVNDIDDTVTMKAKPEESKVWLVTVKLPKRLVDDEIDKYLSLGDEIEDLEIDAVAADADMAESGFDDMGEDDFGGEDLANEF